MLINIYQSFLCVSDVLGVWVGAAAGLRVPLRAVLFRGTHAVPSPLPAGAGVPAAADGRRRRARPLFDAAAAGQAVGAARLPGRRPGLDGRRPGRVPGLPAALLRHRTAQRPKRPRLETARDLGLHHPQTLETAITTQPTTILDFRGSE